ncbi:MAG: amidohydrolase [Proteobacteria bacterium]|nr:amidohydrolase [Pseudomonadota bacterium]
MNLLIIAAADLLLINANIHTVDAQHPTAQWIAIHAGKIEALGDGKPPVNLQDAHTRTVDVHHKLVLPAFHDPHTHPIWGGLSHSRCPLYDGNSIEDYKKLITQCAKEDKSEWLYGTGWRDGLFVPSGVPDKRLLDSIVPDRPAVFSNVGGHGLWLNSKALQAAGITRDTPDPPHGRIDRDANGEPIGGLQEAAVELVTSKLPPPSEAAQEKALLYALHYFNSVGIVGFHDALVPIRGDEAAQVIPPRVPDTYIALSKKGLLKAYVTVALGWDRGTGLEQLTGLKATREKLAAAGVQAQTVKFLLDGVPVQRTAALLEPYSDKPDEKGALEVDPETLKKAVAALAKENVQPHFHAIGDGAVHAALDAVEYGQQQTHHLLNRPLVSHVNLVAPADVPRFAALGAIPIFQPLWASMDDYMRLVAVRVGEKRMTHMYPVATLMHAGAKVAYGSDWPVASANPLEGLEVAIARRAPGAKDGVQLAPTEIVSLEDAVRNYTLHAAFALHVEDESGSLTVGKNADLVAIDQDIFHVPATRIAASHVLVTMYKGGVVFGDLGKL